MTVPASPAGTGLPTVAGMDDPYDLRRFVTAQDEHGRYDQALNDLRRGVKRGHWMWYVFPQVAGLGRSVMSQRYAIGSLAEARAYLRHDVLGARLRECASAVAATTGRSAEEIFGVIDAVKLRSSMTLFLRADPGEAVFGQVLDLFFDGVPDPATDRLL
jgi:uncharacterized protein (DUF1810 family)